MNLSMTPPAPRRRRLWPYLALALPIIVLFFTLISGSRQGTELTGVVRSRVEKDILAPYDGVVGVVQVKPGDELAPGAPLFSYDLEAMRQELRTAENFAESLALTLPPAARELVRNPEGVSAAVQEKRLNESSSREAEARHRLEAASDNLARLSVQAEMLRARSQRGEVRPGEIQQAIAQRDDARLQLRGAEKDFEQAGLDRHRQEEALRVLRDMERSLAMDGTPLYRRFTAYKVALGRIDEIRASLGRPQPTLASGGKILAVDIHAGDPVTAGQAVARALVPDPASPRLSGLVSLSPDKVAVGKPARVLFTDAAKGTETEIPAVVVAVAPEGEGSLLTIELGAGPYTAEGFRAARDGDFRVFLEN